VLNWLRPELRHSGEFSPFEITAALGDSLAAKT